MLQAAAAFSAGLLAQEGCAQVPSCSTNKEDGGTAFKLSVQVHSASVPALGEPGILVRAKPRLGVGFGGVWKQTENADFVSGPIAPALLGNEGYDEQWGMAVGSDSKLQQNGDLFTLSDPSAQSRSPGRPCVARPQVILVGSSCNTPLAARSLGPENAVSDDGVSVAGPWRFGDTLTFSAKMCDVLSGGVRLRLSAHSDVVLGPMQLELPQDDEVGEAVIDLRRRVLPACAPGRSRATAYGEEDCHRVYDAWDTPVVVVPLSCVNDNPHSGIEVSVVARVALSFSVSADPEALLREADDTEQPFSHRVERMIEDFSRWMQAPVTSLSCGSGCQVDLDGSEAKMPPRVGEQRRSALRPQDWQQVDETDGMKRNKRLSLPLAPASADLAFKL